MSSILMGSYGFHLNSSNDPLIEEMDRTFEYAHEPPGPSAILLEMFPSCMLQPISIDSLTQIALSKELPPLDAILIIPERGRSHQRSF